MDALAAPVLPPDSTTKLLRVFCLLRQHDRKARIARRTAELNSWKAPPQAAALSQRADDVIAAEELQQASPTETTRDTVDLVDELNLLAVSEEPDSPAGGIAPVSCKSVGGGNLRAIAAPLTTMQELRNEIKDLQKGIITSSSDTSGVISPADLSSCMRSLNRVPSKGEVQWMIWEVDEDLDGNVSWEEFKGCYVRTLLDSHGLELNQLYYLIQFLLCDTDSSQTVSVHLVSSRLREDVVDSGAADEITAELQRIGGTEHLTAKLWSVLDGESEEQQLLRKLSLSEFLDAMLGDLPSSFNLH